MPDMTSPFGERKKFLSPEQLDQAVTDISELLSEGGIQSAVAGGFAMQLYGSDRLTGDLDLIVSETPPSAPPPASPLTFGGIRTTAPNGVPVDLIDRNDGYTELYEEALAAAVTHPSGYRVVGPEYLAAMKMVAGRPKDQGDLMILLVLPTFDLVKARGIVNRLVGGQFGLESFDSFVAEAEWRRDNPGRRRW